MATRNRIAVLVALLGSSAAFAANVTVVPSVQVVDPGSTFYVTVHADGMPDIGAFAVRLSYNTAVVKVVNGGIVQNPPCPSCVFGSGLIVANPFVSGGEVQGLASFDLPLPSGSFNAFQVTFQVLANALPSALANIVVVDGDSGWTDANTFEMVPVTYTQANVMVAPAIPNARDDGPIAVLEGLPKVVPVGSNDSYFTNPVTVTVTTLPTKGTITTISPPGPAAGMTITYTANIGAVGTDSFVYEMTDSTPGSDSATVTVNISPDSDLDGITDASDNCKLASNNAAGLVPGTSILRAQLDSDHDGYGNRCDGDLTNDGLVNTTDYSIFRSLINQSASAFPLAAVADLNGSGKVDTVDWAIFRTLINKAPGPSGLACAGTIPCP